MEIDNNLLAPYYTRSNLELVLGTNRRTLDYRISRLVCNGILERLKPGFYLNKKLLSQSFEKESFLEYIGTIAKYPSYVSLEYALAKYGLIAESIYIITYITSKKTDLYSCNLVTYKYRNIKSDLFTDYEIRRFQNVQYMFAKKYKALFDFIYLTPIAKQKDLEVLLLNSRINWESLSLVDKNNFIDYCQKSGSKKMAQAVKILRKKLLI